MFSAYFTFVWNKVNVIEHVNNEVIFKRLVPAHMISLVHVARGHSNMLCPPPDILITETITIA